MIHVKKTSIYIEPDVDIALARRAAAEGITKAELIRQALREAAGSSLRVKPRARGSSADRPTFLRESTSTSQSRASASRDRRRHVGDRRVHERDRRSSRAGRCMVRRFGGRPCDNPTDHRRGRPPRWSARWTVGAQRATRRSRSRRLPRRLVVNRHRLRGEHCRALCRQRARAGGRLARCSPSGSTPSTWQRSTSATSVWCAPWRRARRFGSYRWIRRPPATGPRFIQSATGVSPGSQPTWIMMAARTVSNARGKRVRRRRASARRPPGAGTVPRDGSGDWPAATGSPACLAPGLEPA